MRTRHFITPGVVKRIARPNDGTELKLPGFDLERWFKKELDSLHSVYYDSCCDAAKAQLPVRFNTTGTVLEYFNGTTWVTAETALNGNHISLADGTVGALALRLGADGNNGIYGVSDTQIGIASEGALVSVFDTVGLKVDSIGELTTGAGITLAKAVIKKNTATAINTTGAATAAQLAGGLITSTSAATVALTLPTGSALGTQLGAAQGTTFEFYVDNSAGANIVTVTVASGITAITAVLTGSATLTVAAGVVGQFKLYFTSASAAVLSRTA